MAAGLGETKKERVPGEVAALGDDIYNARFRAIVEPENTGKYIAIHVDSGDYVIDRTVADAARALTRIHAVDGRIFTRRIGEEPEYELAARILAGDARK